MKKPQREKHKLVLDRETIRALTDLVRVVGGRANCTLVESGCTGVACD